MKVCNYLLLGSITLIALRMPRQVQAALIDVSAVQFTGFVPDPIQPGQRPTSFGYKYHYDKQTAATVNASFALTITFSSDATLGGVDDFSLGTFNTVTGPVGGNSGDVMATTSNPNGITSFLVPIGTQHGEYHAFVTIAPRDPHFDSDVADAIGKLPGTVTVGMQIPGFPGDFNRDGLVDAADYVVWRNGLGTQYSQADYDVWRANFGRTRTSSLTTDRAIPEPASFIPLLLGFVATFLCRITFASVPQRYMSSNFG
jgi:hypothetical protein